VLLLARVTRLGESSPIGWLLVLDIFFSAVHVMQSFLTKNNLGYILGDFWAIFFRKPIWSPCYARKHVIHKQSDQMSLWNNRPNYSPTNLLSKLKHTLCIRKRYRTNMGCHSKQLPIERKFAQSGHLGDKAKLICYLQIYKHCLISAKSVGKHLNQWGRFN
jgi:hypothetical protein